VVTIMSLNNYFTLQTDNTKLVLSAFAVWRCRDVYWDTAYYGYSCMQNWDVARFVMVRAH